MAFLCALAFLTYFDRVCIMRAQGDIQRDLHLTNTQMGSVMSIFWLAYAAFEIPGGWLGDRFGSRRALTRIVAMWSLFTALSGMAVGYLSMLTCRFLFGAGEAGAFPNMARVQSRWLPARSRARAGGLLWLVARWGGAFSPLIFGTVIRTIDSNVVRRLLKALPGGHWLGSVPSWRLGFWVSGIVGVVWLMLFFPWFRDDPAEKPSVNQAELDLIRGGDDSRDPHHHAAAGRDVWLALFTSPVLWALAIAYFCVSFGWSFYVSWMPRFLQDVHGVTFQKSELMNAVPLFLGGISCLVGGWLSDRLVKRPGYRRFGRALFPICGYLTAAAAMFLIRLTHTPHQAVALMGVASFASDFGQAAAWATVISVGGLYAGTAFGFMNMVGNLGNVLQPIIGAAVFGSFGWGPLFILYAGVYLVAAGMWLLIDPNQKFYRESPPGGFEVAV